MPIDGSACSRRMCSAAARIRVRESGRSDIDPSLDTLSSCSSVDSMSSALRVIFALAAFSQSALLAAGVFDAVVHSPNWRRAESLLAYRKLFRFRHPGHFFQVAAPVTIILLLTALVLS